ncbi:MAG: alanine--tRNA ligase [Gallionellales bacterium 35-53-114]|jgi:alanyl-tRNA synthetase|nr:MAG: alanine--tRNA ligase [Gallionellales bacterium 35-53-114]OYZ62840.1 MAG: alanine--tRNA ligase [Gallionellales bacterium 24-53-125]OZB09915.1 MAG: alanine--tRNA ligase [Gallionellales bacterium 39-52-133]HQS58416.1 alanine--tRNA ligase [Gallionellaceae bacterium]HQS73971.1 alanine--tRNA ligase [Gallionellaceae bacterium]
MKSSEIRQKFLDYFATKGHTIVPSSSLVPHEDPTLLFTNAGMNQFKDVFLGFDKRPYTRATTSQKCVRAGGKHNDLENVGYTARHHTFFEMLGNFSFGDYFKRDAINYAWELLTVEFNLPRDRLTVTVYAEDDEAYDIWTKEIGVPAERVIRIGDNKGARYASDNFWMMGDTGPCGPCTEIFYDHGDHIAGGPPGSPDENGDRFIEIWNNVFMQFNRDEQGVLHPLPKPSVDTGMGLERISAVLQHVHANYEIDLFQALIKAAARETRQSNLDQPSLRVLADHIRACSFLIADGVIPGNEGRGYVLRRIIRRAIRHGYKLGARDAFFYKMVPDLVAQMGVAYPELVAEQVRVKGILKLEEERFFATIEHGMAILEADLAEMTKSGSKVFNGETAFKLHDTFGFPLDLTQDVCREHGVTVDAAAFDRAMAQQKEQARAAGKFKMAANLDYAGPSTTFHGYDTLEHKGNILALYKDSVSVNELNEGEMGVVVLDDTPFYAESGGQVGDSGELRSTHGIFAVEDTQKIQAAVFGHHGVVKTGKLTVGNSVLARVDVAARSRTMRNHSATHLMHKALREVLGTHVQQKGSQVDADKTRFDFVHTQPMTDEEIRKVEDIVNREILENSECRSRVMAIEEAQKTGAMMLFGEKYGDEVRVLDIGSSIELCGGTHVKRTGDIGLFKIVAESGVAAGVRRVEAVTGTGALARIELQEQQLQQVADAVKSQPQEAAARVAQIIDNVKALEKELSALKSKLASSQGDELVTQAVEINGVKVLAVKMEGADATTLRETMDKLKDKLKTAAIVLAAVADGKVSLIAGVTADTTSKVKAGELVNFVAQQVGGKGGGRPDMAQAGGTQPENLANALAGVNDWVKAKL